MEYSFDKSKWLETLKFLQKIVPVDFCFYLNFDDDLNYKLHISWLNLIMTVYVENLWSHKLLLAYYLLEAPYLVKKDEITQLAVDELKVRCFTNEFYNDVEKIIRNFEKNEEEERRLSVRLIKIFSGEKKLMDELYKNMVKEKNEREKEIIEYLEKKRTENKMQMEKIEEKAKVYHFNIDYDEITFYGQKVGYYFFRNEIIKIISIMGISRIEKSLMEFDEISNYFINENSRLGQWIAKNLNYIDSLIQNTKEIKAVKLMPVRKYKIYCYDNGVLSIKTLKPNVRIESEIDLERQRYLKMNDYVKELIREHDSDMLVKLFKGNHINIKWLDYDNLFKLSISVVKHNLEDK